MKLNKAQLIGLFIVVVIIALYAVINFLKDENIFNGKHSYYVCYNTVEGLSEGSPIYIKGLKTGAVSSVHYNRESGNFIIALKVDNKFEIPENSVAKIGTSGFLGGTQINIELGNSNLFLQNRDTISGDVDADMISSIMGTMGPLTAHLDSLLVNLNSVVEKIDGIMDAQRQEELRNTLSLLNSTMSNAQSITATLKHSTPEIEAMLKNLSTLAANLNAGSHDLNETLKNTNTITKGLSEADLKGTLDELKSLLVKIQDPDGSIGKLLTTDSLHNSLDAMINSISSLVKKIEENPKKYIRVTVF